MILGEEGDVVAILKAARNEAHRLIEEFMLAANEAVARHLVFVPTPAVYRVHDRPDESRLAALRIALTDVAVTPAKTGEACSMSILGIVTTGDSSVPTAAKAGGIKKIASVDNTFMQVLGLYAKYCTVVSGE